MQRVGRWLDRGRAKATSSSGSLDLAAEAQNMDIALKAAEKLLDDDLSGAEAQLSLGDSAFHKLAKGTLGFMKAALGFEQDVMKEASALLAEAENSAYDYQYKAQHDHTAFASSIYDRGSEFALCQAEAQIMSAIVGVLNESVTESIKGFYKMRKAYGILEGLIVMEQNFMKAQGVQSLNNSRMASTDSLSSALSKQPVSTRPVTPNVAASGISHQPSRLRQAETPGQVNDDSDDEDAFFEVDEKQKSESGPSAYSGRLAVLSNHQDLNEKMMHMSVNDSTRDATGSTIVSPVPVRPGMVRAGTSKFNLINLDADSELFSNSLDIFIHSGTNLMFGIISLMISVIPPAFAKILSIIGFRGDREKGMRMLWQASKFANINGGMAALVLFGWYNGAIGFCDIVSESDPDVPDDVEGYPIDRLKALLAVMRKRYPKSHLWVIEESRMAAASRNLDLALELLQNTGKSELKQLEALQMFEKSLDAMNSHRYQLCADSFLECVEKNAWSQALYYYIAGAAFVSMYRDAVSAGDTATAEKCKLKAEEYFKEAPKYVGKKKMMGRQLPFDAFVQRKLAKWTDRASTRGCSLIDAIGVSPLEEMSYLWNGYKKMDRKHLQISLDNLMWSERKADWSTEELDERSIHAILRATILRNLRQHEEAKALLKKEILSHTAQEYAGQNRDNWPGPAAHYEYAVNLWQQRKEFIKRHGAELASPQDSKSKPTAEEIIADKPLVAEAKVYIEKARAWGSYELDARIGMRLTAAIGAITKWEKKHGVSQ